MKTPSAGFLLALDAKRFCSWAYFRRLFGRWGFISSDFPVVLLFFQLSFVHVFILSCPFVRGLMCLVVCPSRFCIFAIVGGSFVRNDFVY